MNALRTLHPMPSERVVDSDHPLCGYCTMDRRIGWRESVPIEMIGYPGFQRPDRACKLLYELTRSSPPDQLLCSLEQLGRRAKTRLSIARH